MKVIIETDTKEIAELLSELKVRREINIDEIALKLYQLMENASKNYDIP